MIFTPEDNGERHHLAALYIALDADVQCNNDTVTDGLLARGYQGYALPSTLRPGRGDGVADVPELKLVRPVGQDPNDINQGGVGDCWLLAAISAIAEFDGAIAKIFRKTPDLLALPGNASNTYIVTLYDLPTMDLYGCKSVDIEIDERLCAQADGNGLLGARPSSTGELWVPYLEKAVAVHSGGWDKIDGGHLTHAWRILTGCPDQYTIRLEDAGLYRIYNNMEHCRRGEEAGLANCAKDGFNSYWPSDWPQVGGGGGSRLGLSSDQLFERMCAWEDAGYMMACYSLEDGAAKALGNGLVDVHAYTILDVCNDVDGGGGNTFDMVQVRNPWGRGEFQSGKWDDDGPGWDEFPLVKEVLKHEAEDDGAFWLDKHEFFKFFVVIYLCAKDMRRFADETNNQLPRQTK